MSSSRRAADAHSSGSDDGSSPVASAAADAAAPDAAAAAASGKKQKKQRPPVERNEKGQTVQEVAQLETLRALLAKKVASTPDYVAPDLDALDRKDRNRLEKRLMKEDPHSHLAKAEERRKKQEKKQKAAEKAAKASEAEVANRAKLAEMLAAGRLPAKLAEQAAKLSKRGRNPFALAAPAGGDSAAATAAAAAPALSDAELAWAKHVLEHESRLAEAALQKERDLQTHIKKKHATMERYRLPPELHIPQELIVANPVADARRLKKEAELFIYDRNTPNYVEKVAKVRKQFIESLPAATGAGDASGADGNAHAAPRGWDANTKLVGEFKDPVPRPAAAAAAAAPTSEEEAGPPRKKSKSNKEGASVAAASSSSSTAAAPAAPAAASPQPPLHESYHPRFVSSFSWLPEQASLRKDSVAPQDPQALLEYTASRMVQPGAPYPYLRPQIPLPLNPNLKGFKVDKPDIVALIMAARVAGITFEEQTTADKIEAAAAKAQSEEAEDKKKDKKSSKKKGKKEDLPALEGQSASSSLAFPLAPPAPAPRLRFVSYRTNFRKFFNRHDYWRVDIQRVGHSIFLRRYLTYNYVNPFDVGHLFEQACKESTVLHKLAQLNGVGKQHRSKENSTTHPYRAIVQADLREFELVTSVEIDLYQKLKSEAASSSSAAAAASSSSSPAVASFPLDPLSSFLELKTVMKPRWDKHKKSDVWIQTFLGGVPKTIVGFKRTLTAKEAARSEKKMHKRGRAAAHEANVEYAPDVSKKKKGKAPKSAGAHAALLGESAAAATNTVLITEVKEELTDKLIGSNDKEALMERFYALMKFVAANVQEGKIYKLEHRKKEVAPGAGKPFVHPSRMAANDADGATTAAAAVAAKQPHTPHVPHSESWTIALEEITGAMESQPIIVPGVIAQIDAWAEQHILQQQKQQQQKSEQPEQPESKESKKSKRSKSAKKEDAMSDVEPAEAAVASTAAEVKSEKQDKKSSKKRKSTSSSKEEEAAEKEDKEEDSEKKSKKSKKQKKEAPVVDAAEGSEKKKKKSTKKESKSSKAEAADSDA